MKWKVTNRPPIIGNSIMSDSPTIAKNTIKKRFIAGAVCPKCHQADALRWWIEHQIEYVECVECHHLQQKMPESVVEHKHSQQQMIGLFRPE